MEAFLASTLGVAIAEMGDKTQLLTLFLAARYRNHWAILAGILIATLINHGISAWLGDWLTHWIPEGWLGPIVGVSFILIGLWVLIPDDDEKPDSPLLRYGPFLATTILLFLAEIGDKTQVATIVLAANYNSLFAVISGTTLGMLLANVPVLIAAQTILAKLPLKTLRISACLVFIVLGISSWWLP
ncbi:TMEM165/GDT1 family protein [Marinobacteraceae bacterium S3BR75-40.1]